MDAGQTVVAEFDDPDDAAWEVERLALHGIAATVREASGHYRVTVAVSDRERATVAQTADDTLADDPPPDPMPELQAECPGRAAVVRAANLIAVCLFWPPLLLQVMRLLARAAPTRLGTTHRLVWLLECGFVGVALYLLSRVAWWVIDP